MKYLTAVVVLLLAQPASGQAPSCEAPSRPDSGRICATLSVENGRLTVSGSPVIVRGSLPATVTDAQIVTSFKAALNEAGMPYQFGWSTSEREEDARNTDPKRVALRTQTSSWESYVGAAAEAEIDTDVMLSGMSGLLGELRQRAGFVTVPDVNQLFDTESGAAQLDIVVLTDMVDIRLASLTDVSSRQAALRSYLKPLFGKLWERPAVIARLTEYYAYLGLTPQIDADPRAKTIEVIEGIRVRAVTLPPLGQKPGETDARDRMKALYSVLDDRDFRLWLKNMPADDAVEYVRDLGRKEGEEPYFFPTRAQVQQLLLAQSDLALQPIPTTSRAVAGLTMQQEYFGLGVTRPSPAARPAPPAAAPSADELGLVNPHGSPAERAADKGPEVVGKPSKPAKEHKNYVGGGVSYLPGQGATLLVLYQRNKLAFPLRDASFGARIARTADNLFSPSVNYFADYVMFERIRRRVSVQFNGSSDAVANRFLDGVYQNVRRSGGLGRVEIEPFRDRGGRLLRLQLEAGRATVTRTSGSAEISQNLTALDLGLLFMQEQLQSLHPWRATVQPFVRWAPGVGNEAAFVRFRATGDAHIQVSRGFELDFAGAVQSASVDTPVFEVPSLGGTESVRGFRADDAIGRFLWSTQNELWTPVPFRSNRDDFLRRVVRLAFFADVGGVSEPTTDSSAGTRAGLGTGLRLNFNPVVLRLDYAHGFGAAATGGSRNRFYFSIKTNLPF